MRLPSWHEVRPNDKFDLVVKGGEVLDPSQNLRAKRDIGIRYGVVEALEADIPAERALKVLNVPGKLVTPGLIDLHGHTYPYGSAIGIPADELIAFQGTTTMVSAGVRCEIRRKASASTDVSSLNAGSWTMPLTAVYGSASAGKNSQWHFSTSYTNLIAPQALGSGRLHESARDSLREC